MFHCNGSGNNYGSYCYVYSDENDACFTAMETGITIRFTAMEAGITMVVTATYTVMKMTRVSLQLRTVSRSLTSTAAATLVHSFVTSRLDYCSSLYIGLPATRLNCLN